MIQFLDSTLQQWLMMLTDEEEWSRWTKDVIDRSRTKHLSRQIARTYCLFFL